MANVEDSYRDGGLNEFGWKQIAPVGYKAITVPLIGRVSSVPIAGVTKDEVDIFNEEYPILMGRFISEMEVDGDGNLTDWFKQWFNDIIGEVFIGMRWAKEAIEPKAGSFNGMWASDGFGWRWASVNHLTPNAQSTNWKTTISTAGWYGFAHNGAVGASYNTSVLYTRKGALLILLGLYDPDGGNTANSHSLEVNGKAYPTDLIEWAFSGDRQVYRFPSVQYLPPAITRFRSSVNWVETGEQNLRYMALVFETNQRMEIAAAFATAERPATTQD